MKNHNLLSVQVQTVPKKIGSFGRKKSHPFPKVFSSQGSARNFSPVEKQRFLMFLKNQPFFKKYTKWPFF